VKKILVVDDSETVRHQVRQALAGGQYTIIECKDGIEGLETIRTSDDLMLVLCDVDMPRMNGLEMVTELQKRGNSVPILMLTTEGDPALVKRAREAGCKGWIVKPFKPQLLAVAVTKFVPAGGDE
jgi:two-component system chemotaxis response regulator CheY